MCLGTLHADNHEPHAHCNTTNLGAAACDAESSHDLIEAEQRTLFCAHLTQTLCASGGGGR
jgi:hypothetical protein